MTVRLPTHLHTWLKAEAHKLSLSRGYAKSMNQMIVDLVYHAMTAPESSRPWRW